MCDGAAYSSEAVAVVGICNRIIASRRSGSIAVAASAINTGVANAGAISTVSGTDNNVADAVAYAAA
jgi:hypothetical protein